MYLRFGKVSAFSTSLLMGSVPEVFPDRWEIHQSASRSAILEQSKNPLVVVFNRRTMPMMMTCLCMQRVLSSRRLRSLSVWPIPSTRTQHDTRHKALEPRPTSPRWLSKPFNPAPFCLASSSGDWAHTHKRYLYVPNCPGIRSELV